MYVNRHYHIWSTIRWSKKPLINALFYSAAVIILYEVTGIPFSLPWQPISVIGIAVAFYLGFKNNSSYDRAWEARKIWGAIVNDSRSIAIGILNLPNSEVPFSWKKQFVYRHLSWLMALKHAMRKEKSWEHNAKVENLVFTPYYQQEGLKGLDPELEKYLNKEEIKRLKTFNNIPLQLLKTQSHELKKLEESGGITEYKHVWLQQLISKLIDNQGMSERIKNFPFPRQYASTGLFINFIFCAMIPFGLLDIFEQSSKLHYWLTVPFSTVIIWVFFLVDRIGDYSENPFEGGYNDVPISSISRVIEIDLLELLEEKDIPEPYPVENGFLM
ncbi:bestrophin family protein [Algoriphagus sp.]|jgi:putative membrane protein|uniref:bestrophin family protein n=1 Tax=Algoriphagus sp. TaxID=1872435 RepID=UPI00271BEEC8|nr:bestrophin family ion channel [Algoriphagus sp.]MDO8966728.1 bestrophin family ion channel [Algoriphagus sp.]MDP3199949.1 bestrophin family ion channel [Algoriphagus sp.]